MNRPCLSSCFAPILLAASSLTLFSPLLRAVEIDATLLAGGYSQSFDTLPGSHFTWVNDSTLAGWSAAPSSGVLDSAARANDGTSNLTDLTLHSVGTGSDRAINYHTRVEAVDTHLGLAFTNATGSPLTGFSLTCAIEQWKEGTNSRTVTVATAYRIGATESDLASADGWTALSGMTVNSLNGSAGAVTVLESGPIEASVPPGGSIWIRWKWSNDATSSTASHDTLALDDVTFQPTAAAAEAAPAITLHPTLQIVAVGETATFTVAATGNPAPTLQWYRGETAIEGATSATLELTDVQLAQAGDYHCVATNPLGIDTSDAATLTVSDSPLPPVITVDPVDTAGDLGARLELSVTATGSAPLTYAWSRGETLIDGANTGTLVLDPLTADDAGVYSVAVSNAAGTATSTPAVVSVNLPPSFTSGPFSQNASGGATVELTAVVSGTAPFTFEWRKDGVPLEGADSATLQRTGLTAADNGIYRVTVSNSLGSATSDPALLTVEVAPLIIADPQSQNVLVGGNASFTVEAVGSGPFTYHWYRDANLLDGLNAATLELAGVSEADVAAYHVTVTNAYGTTTSNDAALTVTEGLPSSAFNLTGFGRATTGGGVIPESDPGYVKVSTPLEFITALADKSGAIKVIEILNDLDLGYLEVEPAVREFSIFREHATPKLHPRLIVTGVSLVDIQRKEGLTLFSANGATIRHACLNIKQSHNIIVRNLKFDEMWEWDEASRGDYDSNDWDFINLGNAGTVWDIWIDHCTFTKAYDGIVDIKQGSYNITFSWNNYVGDDGATNPNSFVRQQINELEKNPGSYPMYQFLRTKGFSVEDIVTILQGPDKTHLIGANSLKAENADHTVTFHHQWYQNPWDRLPRLRGGNVHNYNIFVDAALGRQAKRLRDERVAAMDPSDAAKLSSTGTYNFNVFLNGSISTEDGAILVEKSIYLDCLTPLRNNQTDPSNPIYTGKILGLDCITRMTDNAGVSTTVRGDSTDPGNPMGPFQAPIKPFSWNLPGGVLPYSYTLDDPDNLPEILLAGAGAGRLNWARENWLRTTYVVAPPAIATPLSNPSVGFGTTAVFTVAATGDAPLTYLWKKGTATIPGASGPSLTIAEAVPADAGVYTVTVRNASGEASSSGTLSVAEPTNSELFQYAFGNDSATGEPLMPTLALNGANGLLSFFRKRNDVSYQALVSEDLENWTLLATDPGNVGEWVQVNDAAGAGRPQRFLRMQFMLLNP